MLRFLLSPATLIFPFGPASLIGPISASIFTFMLGVDKYRNYDIVASDHNLEGLDSPIPNILPFKTDLYAVPLPALEQKRISPPLLLPRMGMKCPVSTVIS